MIKTGLTSITFRSHPPEEIIEIVRQSSLNAIEWGGDVHVPHGDLKKAKRIKNRCRDWGIETPSYGSYYRIGAGKEQRLHFASVLDTAVELEASTIRVWAGDRSFSESDNGYFSQFIEESLEIAEAAEAVGMTISFEYHQNTMLDSKIASLEVSKALPSKNILFYWQPLTGLSEMDQIDSLQAILNRVSNVHVFYWTIQPDGNYSFENPANKLVFRYDRRPLSEGDVFWERYLACLTRTAQLHYAFIEYVLNDSVEMFFEDAKTLSKIVSEKRDLK